MKSSGMRIIALAALVAFVALLSAAAAEEKDQPRMMIRNADVNLGDFYEGDDIEYAFVVRNVGAAELRILSVRPG